MTDSKTRPLDIKLLQCNTWIKTIFIAECNSAIVQKFQLVNVMCFIYFILNYMLNALLLNRKLTHLVIYRALKNFYFTFQKRLMTFLVVFIMEYLHSYWVVIVAPGHATFYYPFRTFI